MTIICEPIFRLLMEIKVISMQVATIICEPIFRLLMEIKVISMQVWNILEVSLKASYGMYKCTICLSTGYVPYTQYHKAHHFSHTGDDSTTRTGGLSPTYKAIYFTFKICNISAKAYYTWKGDHITSSSSFLSTYHYTQWMREDPNYSWKKLTQCYRECGLNSHIEEHFRLQQSPRLQFQVRDQNIRILGLQTYELRTSCL